MEYLDSTILYIVQSAGPAWRSVAWVLSYGFGYEAMCAVFVIALVLLRRHRIALELVIIAIASLAVTYVLKEMFQVPRPYVVDPSVIAYDTDGGFGMPSAHALMSVVLLGWMCIRHPKSHILLWGSLGLVLLIGWSRVFLGVHYPSQVVIGWILGIILLFIYRTIYKKLWRPFDKKFK